MSEESMEPAQPEGPEYDKVTRASLNGIYVKAQELDRGHNDAAAPVMLPPGSVFGASSRAVDAQSHASTHTSDAQSHASTHASDVQSHASTHASDVQTHASES